MRSTNDAQKTNAATKWMSRTRSTYVVEYAGSRFIDCSGVAMMMPVPNRTRIITTMIQWKMRRNGLKR